MAARPQTLPASVAPVAVGTAVAHAAGGLRPGPALAAAAGALLLQIASNLANDVFDHEKGADGPERLGPTRAVASGLLRPAAVRCALALVLAVALAVGVYLTLVAGWRVVALGLMAMACAVAYTGGPMPLGYHGLGDLLVLLFFGFAAVCGTAFVQLGRVPMESVWAAIPVGALATGILVVNNLRDRAGDAACGKRTLAVMLGAGGARLEYSFLVAIAYAIPLACAVARSQPLLALPLATLPWGIALVRAVARQDGRALNPCLPATARLLLAHSLLWAAGIAL